MLSFLLAQIIILLIILFLLLILSWVWPPDSPWAPWWQMPRDVIEEMCKLAKVSSKDTIYDLGCGTGKALIYAARTYHAKGVGVEIDPMRYFLAKWDVWKYGQTKHVTIFRKNFFNVNLSGATIIFVYLVPVALKRLTPKFLKEIKPHTKFISYVYPMPEDLFKKRLRLVKYDKEKRIYLYTLLAKS